MKISQIFKTDKDIAKIATVLKFELRNISKKFTKIGALFSRRKGFNLNLYCSKILETCSRKIYLK